MYSVKEFGNKKAKEYIIDLDKSFHKIANNPVLGNNYSIIRPNIKAYRVASQLRFYKISKNGVIIVRVLHKAIDYKKHL